MQCYQHNENVSVGLCKACQKAVCSVCATDTGRGLACSEPCSREVGVLNEIIDRSKQIYGIGSRSKLPPTGILFYLFFAGHVPNTRKPEPIRTRNHSTSCCKGRSWFT